MEELLNVIIQMIEDNIPGLSNTIDIGQLEPSDENSIACQYAPGTTETTFLDKGNVAMLSILFLSKNDNQITALNDMDLITRYLESLKVYEQPTNGIELVDIMTTTRPQWVDKEDNGKFIYSAVIAVKISQ